MFWTSVKNNASIFKSSLMYRGCFMKNFHFNTICNITQEPRELQTYICACGFIGKSAVIKYNLLLSKVTSINRKSHFDQVAISFLLYPSLKQLHNYSAMQQLWWSSCLVKLLYSYSILKGHSVIQAYYFYGNN